MLPLTQALAYLLGELPRSSINRDEFVLDSTYDYVFSSKNDETIASMTYWDFVAIIETFLSNQYPTQKGKTTTTTSNNVLLNRSS